jgi:hypothetical protein
VPFASSSTEIVREGHDTKGLLRPVIELRALQRQ